ncbi:unnamed protein product [Trichobilharzia regenti]|nr:unnamed protein product [Trichobilharzia regenti]
MRLRQESVKLYASSHNWYWFDNQAVLWHPYANESMRAIDKRFHRGDLFAAYDVNRRPYIVEFPTMTQLNLLSIHRRPVLLFPSSAKDTETNTEASMDQMSSYELSLMNTEVPECLNPVERSKLCQALIQHLRALKRTSSVTTQSNAASLSSSSTDTNLLKSSDHQTPLPSDCLNAMFRLLLRLCFTSYENARELAESDFLTVLFTYPHAKEFSADYSAFVGALISEVFDDAATSERIMKEILTKMSKYGIPSAFMGIEAGPRSCRDLFYLLNMCSPLFAKDRQRAMKLTSETFSLSIPKTDLETKSYPKTYTVEEAGHTSERATLLPLTSRQKHLLTQLMDLIMSPPALKDTNARGDDTFISMTATLDPTLINTMSPASSTTTVNWGLTISTTTTNHPQQSSMPCCSSSSSDANKQQKTGLIVLGKLDALRYLIDLVGTYKSVAEFIAMYKQKHTEPSVVAAGKSTTDTASSSSSSASSPRCSFLSHLFSYELTDANTNEVTMSLLENLLIISSESIQRLIINEFKASLNRISVKSSSYADDNKSDSVASLSSSSPSLKNERISSHMMFLIRILALPKPLVMPILRLLYKRRISADIARLYAIIGCNLANTQSTINYMLRALENFTLVHREYSKLLYAQSKQRPEAGGVAAVGNHNSVGGGSGRQQQQQVNTSTNSSSAHDNVQHSSSIIVHGSSSINRQRIDASISSVPGGGSSNHNTSRDFETDSDDEDDEDQEDNDISMLDHHQEEEFSHPVQNVETAFSGGGGGAVGGDGGGASSSSPASNLSRVLSDVLAAQADMVVIATDHHHRHHHHHHGGNNNIRQPWRRRVSNASDPEARSPRRRRRHRPHRIDSTSISLTVTTSRPNNQNLESQNNDDDNGDMLHEETGNIVLHDDTHVVDARSYAGIDIDDYSEALHDTIREDVAIILPEVRNTIFYPENRGSRGSHSASTVVEQALRRFVGPTLSAITTNSLRDIGTNSLSTINQPRGGNSGNWDLLFPSFTNFIAGGDGPRRSAVDTTNSGLSGTTVFRINPGGNAASSMNNQMPQSPQTLPTATIANQHPLLQVPTSSTSSYSAPSTHTVNIGGSSRNSGSNGLRLTSRPIVTNTMSTANRVLAHLPPIPQQHVPPHYGTRHRITALHPSSSIDGWRYHSIMNRLYSTESDAADHATSSGSNSHSRNPATSDARDNRYGTEANELVWSMLSNLAEDQPSPANSALAAAIFSRFFSPLNRIQQGAMDINSRGINHAQLIPYAGYALPPHYRRWINLCRMLFGHEIMDIILLSRHHIYKVLEERRHEVFKLRIAESENSENTGDSPTECTTTAQIPLTPDVVSPAETLEISSNSEVPNTGDQGESSNTTTNTTAGQSETQPTTTSTAENISNLVVSNTAPTRPPVMMTDEETIQSLVEGGMDPSFLDALPEEMRQEVIADHRYARQVQQQISSMSLPEHINSEWLTGLPPHIQEEVLAQFRQEQQQQRQSSAQPPTTQSTNTNPSEQLTQPATSQSNTDSNTAFLASLPPSVLREVLADMEESQFETLPQHLVTEANRLRREHEERYARAVQNGLLSHSNDTRPDRK